MDEWEAKYRALCMGISNPEYIENAVKLVQLAQRLAAGSTQTFDQVMWGLMHIVGQQQAYDTRRVLRGLNPQIPSDPAPESWD